MRFAPALLYLSVAGLLKADGLADFTAALGRIETRSAEPVKIDVRFREEAGEKGRPAQGESRFEIEAAESASGLQIRWRSSDLQAIQAESHARDTHAASLTPLRDAMVDLDPGRVSHLLHQERTLASWIRQCAFVSEGESAWKGRPARLLSFTFKPRVPPMLSSRLKSSAGTLQVWIDREGLPLHSHMEQSYAGRPGRIFPLRTSLTEEDSDYQAVGGSLRVARRERRVVDSDFDTRRSTDLVLEVTAP